MRLEGINIGLSNSTFAYECDFDGIGAVPAAIVGNDAIECVTPLVSIGKQAGLDVQLRILVDGMPSFNSITFRFYGRCSEGICDNGYCSLGRCLCHHGFQGVTCNVTLAEPMIADTPEVFENGADEPFQFQLYSLQGSRPVVWSIDGKEV